MIKIRFLKSEKLKLIKHTFVDPTKECGGFLFGRIKHNSNDIVCDIDFIYYELLFGTAGEFNFNISYIARARSFVSNDYSTNLIGTYHSHGNYPASFSEIDRNKLQKYFGANKITMIYSPKTGKLIADFMDENYCSHKARIITK